MAFAYCVNCPISINIIFFIKACEYSYFSHQRKILLFFTYFIRFVLVWLIFVAKILRYGYTTHAKLIAAMTDYDKGDAMRIQHFMKVHDYAVTIATLEGGREPDVYS